jgi:hypothetical protein
MTIEKIEQAPLFAISQVLDFAKLSETYPQQTALISTFP